MKTTNTLKSINTYINEALKLGKSRYDKEHILSEVGVLFEHSFFEDTYAENEEEKFDILEKMKNKKSNNETSYITDMVIHILSDNELKFKNEINKLIIDELANLADEYLKNFNSTEEACLSWYEEYITNNELHLSRNELNKQKQLFTQRNNQKYLDKCIAYIKDYNSSITIIEADIEWLLSNISKH